MLRWSLSYRYAQCGTAIAVDGNGDTPAEIRDAVIAESREWELYRNGIPSNVVSFTTPLRHSLGLSVAEAIKLPKAGLLMNRPSISLSLRIVGDALDVAEVTRLLGCGPSDARQKGDEVKSSHFVRHAPTGVWTLKADYSDRDIDSAVAQLLRKLTTDISACGLPLISVPGLMRVPGESLVPQGAAGVRA